MDLQSCEKAGSVALFDIDKNFTPQKQRKL
jgi:hypothetical protein